MCKLGNIAENIDKDRIKYLQDKINHYRVACWALINLTTNNEDLSDKMIKEVDNQFSKSRDMSKADLSNMYVLWGKESLKNEVI